MNMEMSLYSRGEQIQCATRAERGRFLLLRMRFRDSYNVVRQCLNSAMILKRLQVKLVLGKTGILLL